MMNIFILLMVVLFMAGYFLMESPSRHIAAHDTQTAVETADMRTIAQCTATAHSAALADEEFNDVCVTQNNISNHQICLNDRGAVMKCEVVRDKKPAASYIITTAAPVADDSYNAMMEILEADFPNAGTFGIFQDGVIVSGGNTSKRTVPKAVIDTTHVENGQLIYMTQFALPDIETEFTAPDAADIDCPAGSVKSYRFGRWQCVGVNLKTNCAGDMIWDSEIMECVPDESRKPLCASRQTAVMIDDMWECINPFPDQVCADNMVARLNYTTLEWECVQDPSVTEPVKKCTAAASGAVYGPLGATLRITTTSCTDCEEMITNTDTCASYCIPNPTKINDPKCYPGGSAACDGPTRAFYFGFPSRSYAARVPAVADFRVPLDRIHSQNRKFNCFDCGSRGIDASRSLPPYIVVCNE